MGDGERICREKNGGIGSSAMFETSIWRSGLSSFWFRLIRSGRGRSQNSKLSRVVLVYFVNGYREKDWIYSSEK